MQQHLQWKEAIAGAMSGLMTALLLHPLDVVKTRLQVQDGLFRAEIPPYRGTWHALHSIARIEGLSGLYAGLTPSLIGSGMAWGMYWMAFKSFQTYWKKQLQQDELGWEQNLMCGLGAGSIVSLCTNPVWVIKTRLQLQRQGQWRAAAVALSAQASSHSHAVSPHAAAISFAHAARSAASGGAGAGSKAVQHYKGFVDALVTIARDEGVLRGFYRGIGPQLLLVSHGAIQFMLYEELKTVALKNRAAAGNSSTAATTMATAKSGAPLLTTAETVMMGIGAKLGAACCTYPLQVVKARMQQKLDPRRYTQYTSIVSSLRSILRKEGVSGLYKGFFPNMLRVCPQSALHFLFYEFVRARL